MSDRPKRMSGSKPTTSRRGRKTTPREGGYEHRMMTEKVRTARGRKLSSKLWIERQINDPYVQRAVQEGYRSRAAFKLIELDEKFNLIRPGMIIVDLGAAPGGWTQVALKKGALRVIGIDILPVESVPGAEIIEMDFTDPDAPERLQHMLSASGATPKEGERPLCDLVMSDLAANTTGHRNTDHLKTVALVEAAVDFALNVLKPGGHFVTKVFQGGAEKVLLARLRSEFKTVRHAKPKASRPKSPEMYLVATGYKGHKGKG